MTQIRTLRRWTSGPETPLGAWQACRSLFRHMTAQKSRGSLGGGGLWLGVAKLWFLVAAYAVSIGLTHLHDPDTYGQYYVVARLIAVPNMVIIYTVLFAVSRPLAAQYDAGCPGYGTIRARGLKLAALLGGASSVVFFAGSPALAALLGDGDLDAPIAAVAPISLVYALYAVNLGTLNAVRRFRRQAALDMFMAGAKAALIIGAAALGFGLTVTVAGFTAASMLAFGLSVVLVAGVRPAQKGEATPIAPMAAFAGILIVFTAIVNLLQSADVLLLKRFAQTAAQDDAVGFYSSAQQVALVPYSLMNAIALVMFPLVASIDGEQEPARVRAYLGQTAKVCVLLLALMSSVASAAAGDIQALLFPRAYGAAANELRLLVWGFSGCSLAVTTAWIFNSANRSRAAVILVVVPLVVVVIGSLVLVPRMFTSGSAWAVAAAGGAAAISALVGLRQAFGATLPVLSLLKVGVAVGAVALVAMIWPAVPTAGIIVKLAILAKLVALTVAFVGVVFVTRVVTPTDLQDLRRAG